MTDGLLSDVQIASLTPAQRRDLIFRLQQPLDALMPAAVVARMRRIRLSLMIVGAVALIPWTVYLALTLPPTYAAHNWPATWVGFDALLVAFMAATAVFGYLRRHIVLLCAFSTGVLLICDAWFDLMTAQPGELWKSVLTAVGVELPVAAIMITGALRVLRMTLTRLWLLEPGARLWEPRLLP